jgi:hypothetical protein
MEAAGSASAFCNHHHAASTCNARSCCGTVYRLEQEVEKIINNTRGIHGNFHPSSVPVLTSNVLAIYNSETLF